MVSEICCPFRLTQFLTRLNPCYSGRWSRRYDRISQNERRNAVLILVVVEDGLGEDMSLTMILFSISLNPCFTGRWSRNLPRTQRIRRWEDILILVVVEEGRGVQGSETMDKGERFLILVLVEDGLRVNAMSTVRNTVTMSLSLLQWNMVAENLRKHFEYKQLK